MYNFEKKLISVAYYLHVNGALGYWEAVALMRYHFDMHHEIAEEHALKLISACERKAARGDKVTAYSSIWNDPYIFNYA